MAAGSAMLSDVADEAQTEGTADPPQVEAALARLRAEALRDRVLPAGPWLCCSPETDSIDP